MKNGICKEHPEHGKHEYREHEQREHEMSEGKEEGNPFRRAKLPKNSDSFWSGLNSNFR